MTVRSGSAIARLYRALLEALAVVAASILGLTALLVTLDVVSRNVSDRTFPWIVEVTEYGLPVATLLAAPLLLYRNEHVRLDLLLTRLGPRNARLVNLFGDLVGVGVSAALLVYSLRAISDSAGREAMVYKTLVFPEWWLFVPMPLCFGLLLVEFSRRMRVVRGARASEAPQ